MMQLILSFVLLTVVALVSPMILPGVKVKGLSAALLVALVFGILNLLIGWLLNLFLIPLGCLPDILLIILVPTIVNTVLLKITDMLLDPFELKGWWPALGMGCLLGLANLLAKHFF